MRNTPTSSEFTRAEFVQNLSSSGLFSKEELRKALDGLEENSAGEDARALAQQLTVSGKLTAFQAEALLERKSDELVLGNYEILDRLGQGGMGTVFKARHRRMKRVVAIKVLARHIAQDTMFVQRFQREVETVARLSHPNIVMAFDADEAETGPFLVMEFVNGRDLASRVQQQGPLPLRDAVDCLLQASRGLTYAHAQKIVHRDIKPANLLQDVSGMVKVADLGLARLNDAVGSAVEKANSLTQAGSVVGTVDFMAPEQAEDSTVLDNRADIYSLGCTLYFLLMGRAPYAGNSVMGTLLKHRTAPIPSLCKDRPEVPPALETVLQRMMAKQLPDRYASLDEVIPDLETILATLPKLETVSLNITPLPATASVGDQTVALGSLAQMSDTGKVAADTPGAQTIVAAPEAAQARSESPQAAPSALAVLLVEPSRTQSVIVRKYLQELGFRNVQIAPSGQKALDMIRTAKPFAVVSAMHLNDLTGAQLARILREDPTLTGLGFVLISSESDVLEVSVVRELSRMVMLAKPFTKEQLGQALRQATEHPATEDLREVKRDLGACKVLVVEDSPVSRMLMKRVLGQLNLKLIVDAANGNQALELLRQEPFDLVITDYHMPGIDGRDLTLRIRQCSKVPILMVTAEEDPTRLSELRQAGVSAFCNKQFAVDEVRRLLNQLLK